MINTDKPPGLLKRLAVMLYDLLLVIAVLFLATLFLLPFNQGEAFQPNSIAYPIYLFFVGFIFYGWFWTHGGQTLGLMAWKLQLVSNHGQILTWKQSLIRFVVAIFSWGLCGVGILWILFNPQRLTWHDLASKTHLEWKIKT
jgi:uncharacterized RDD family membrane protein YckC